MKNVQIIDGAANCTYDVFAFTDEEFNAVFPLDGQDIEFIEDVLDRLGEDALGKILRPVWKRLVKKPHLVGLHGTLFYELLHKKRFYPTKKSDEMVTGLASFT